jgi:hypothetical protein
MVRRYIIAILLQIREASSTAVNWISPENRRDV